MFLEIKNKILNSRPVRKTIALSKVLVLPGFDNLAIYYVASFFVKGIQKGLIATKASSMAFKFFMSLFPTIIFLLTLIPHIPIENFQEELLSILKDLLPDSGYEFTENTIVSLVTNSQDGLLSFGFLFAVYLATNGIDGMLLAFKDSYNTKINRNAFEQKGLSLSLLFILTLLLVIAIAAILFTEYMVNYILDPGSITSILLLSGKWLIIAALCFFAISFIYYLGGDRTHRWRFFSAGSTLATLMVLIVSFGFGYYVNNFANYNKVYGSIGTIIVVMLWIYFNSIVLLVGFELNASIQQAGSIEKVEEEIENKAIIS
ncbi:MAG: YihY/virulence factor BrkB family protein [Bacteroidetes bacterium]|nr:MAG: YihY/virulence factor BrkB family protein [Bacteroidota bacterium]MBL1144645.1 YihY/virulence factor BrkB family protein [Bacteroidota bacterium]MCB0802187.1 YihY/virulence factor BrkB family protein [Flavobacteriales bacterium]NOG57440.1 YihY/virulence factor BrkB family protein [Bacteroidota bacterium]